MTLKVIGLISGGKDSLFNLAHCLQNGHQIVALANLYPETVPSNQETPNVEIEADDLNSFMYQTVGHSLIPLYADALNVPLYRRAISGTAAQTGLYYDTSRKAEQDTSKLPSEQSPMDTTHDETEDMYLLIKDVLCQYPEANALAAGAILSTYQRTRVESVATRLDLTPLAYLWQYPFLPPTTSHLDSLTRLLEDMAISGCDARIIKLASGGIDSSLLFTNIMQSKPRLRLVEDLSQLLGVGSGREAELRASVLGEGGEYETIALDGPMPLWEKRIDVQMTESLYSEGASYAKLDKAVLIDKTDSTGTNVPVPGVLDARFQTVLNGIQSSLCSSEKFHVDDLGHEFALATTYALSNSTLQITNLIVENRSTSTAAEQLTTILNEMLPNLLRTICTKHNLPQNLLTKNNIVHSILLLRSMDVFASINGVYTTHLWPTGLPKPPSRVTVATILPPNVEVSLSVTIDLASKSRTRNGLHVQSRSYWAPANIGPYSQAVTVPLQRSIRDRQPKNHSPPDSNGIEGTSEPAMKIVHMAGQIPLIPATMALPETDFEEQAVLALQHLWRVGQERGVDLWAGAGVAYLAPTPGSVRKFSEHARSIATQAWTLAHAIDEKGKFQTSDEPQEDPAGDERDAVDIWDMRQNRGYGHRVPLTTIGEHLHVLPNYDVLAGEMSVPTAYVPPFIAAEISALPRGASIEWWSFGLAGLASSLTQDRYRLSVREIQVENWIDACILAIEKKSEYTLDTDEDVEETTNVYFITLIISADTAMFDFPSGSLDGILAKCIAETAEVKPGSIQVVTLHSFINIKFLHVATICQTEMVKDSAIIPCHHVWAACGQNLQQQTVREATVAILLRVEAGTAD